jgi:acyl carrier protein
VVAASNGDDRLHEQLVAHVATVLGLRADRINPNRPLNKMGMDSLMAVELRNRVERELKVKVPVVHLLNGGTVTSLAETVRGLLAETSGNDNGTDEGRGRDR